jgi:hypothetical protein
VSLQDFIDHGLTTVMPSRAHVGGFEVKAKARMESMDLLNKSFDIQADVPWSAVFVVSGVVSGVVATVMVAGTLVTRLVQKL